MNMRQSHSGNRAAGILSKLLRFRKFQQPCCGLRLAVDSLWGKKREIFEWHSVNSIVRSLRSRFAILSLAFPMFGMREALAQESPVAQRPGFSFGQAQQSVEPVSDFLAYLVQFMVNGWAYLMNNSAAAILLSAIIAYVVARASINSSREIARLRETFNTIDLSIKDKDMIEVRRAFKKVKVAIDKSSNDIAKYHNSTKQEDIEVASSLNTILQDYENRALGVRHNILDENYLHRWTRTLVIQDWNYLMPLVTAKRSDGNANAYIEFEGLAAAWQQNLSYRTGKKIKTPKRRMKIH